MNLYDKQYNEGVRAKFEKEYKNNHKPKLKPRLLIQYDELMNEKSDRIFTSVIEIGTAVDAVFDIGDIIILTILSRLQ